MCKQKCTERTPETQHLDGRVWCRSQRHFQSYKCERGHSSLNGTAVCAQRPTAPERSIFITTAEESEEAAWTPSPMILECHFPSERRRATGQKLDIVAIATVVASIVSSHQLINSTPHDVFGGKAAKQCSVSSTFISE